MHVKPNDDLQINQNLLPLKLTRFMYVLKLENFENGEQQCIWVEQYDETIQFSNSQGTAMTAVLFVIITVFLFVATAAVDIPAKWFETFSMSVVNRYHTACAHTNNHTYSDWWYQSVEL